LADSAREQLVSYLETTLQRMDSGRGYHFDWAGCQRWAIIPPADAGWPYSSLLDQRESVTETSNRLHRTLEIAIGGWHEVEFGRDDEPAKASLRLISDIERALMSDRKQGGHALDTLLTGSEPQINPAAQPSIFVEVTAQIMYRTNITEPTEAL